MELKKHNLLVYILLVGLLASAVFGCIYYAQTMLTMNMGSSTTMSECCDAGALFMEANHNVPLIMGGSFQLLFLILAATIYLLVRSHRIENNYNTSNYIKVKYRYGGFNIFNNFITIFRKGIIHPKIY